MKWIRVSKSHERQDEARNRVIWVLLLALLSPSHYVAAQKDASDARPSAESDWVFNFSQTPLEIRVIGIRDYELTNQSSARTKKYTLGCLRLDVENRHTIVYRLKPQEVEIEPGKSWGMMAFHVNPDRSACQRLNSKLTVVDVVFENAVEWRAPVKPQ
jgi:hypothetical protein